MDLRSFLEQAGLALTYYAGLIVIMRMAGKRLAGQTTTFDLIVLIALGVALQNTVLRDGTGSALVFIVTVFLAHKGLAVLCARHPRVREAVRGKPRPLVRDGVVLRDALADENMGLGELLAGLRKLGHDSPATVKLALLEETGHVSVVEAAGSKGNTQAGEEA